MQMSGARDLRIKRSLKAGNLKLKTEIITQAKLERLNILAELETKETIAVWIKRYLKTKG
jgi:hypothetical protein